MGDRSLPLWIADEEWAGFSDRDTTSAQDGGSGGSGPARHRA